MCGIGVLVHQSSVLPGELLDCITETIKPRGPDAYLAIHRKISANQDGLISTSLHMIGSVLHMRGPRVTPQPVVVDGMALLFNGEIFGLSVQEQRNSKLTSEDESDTLYVSEKLAQLGGSPEGQDVLKVMETLQGPWAFVWWHERSGKLFYGHDKFGRRSLVYHLPDESHPFFLLASSTVATGDESIHFEEVPCLGIFEIDLSHNNLSNAIPSCHQWVGSTIIQPKSALGHVEQFEDPVCQNRKILQAAPAFLQVLEAAVASRVRNLSSYPHETFVAILFSGGVDSVVLAALAHRSMPISERIDLLNVCFDEYNDFQSPDRIAALDSFHELQTLYPQRLWRFVRINVSSEEVVKQEQQICSLMKPCCTIMDFNIATAFWYLGRATGFASTTQGGDLYTSKARVLIVGIGADEQLAGYRRHKSAFDKGGEFSLREELDLDIQRIWKRNLGRDDRILSSHGRESRYPYLDENVVHFLRGLAVSEIADFEQNICGDKMILRVIARYLGLNACSLLSKRAIQFGSKIAKQTNKRNATSNRKAKGTTSVNI